MKHSDAKIYISLGSPDLQRGKVGCNWLQGWNFHLEVETFTSPSAEKRSYLFLDQETFQTHIRSPKFLHAAAAAKSHQSYLTLCDPIDVNLPGSSVPGILQARILEWLAISFSRGSFPSRDRTGVYCICCIGRWILYHWATSMVFQGLVLKASIFFT